ncbi:MAG: sugar phosphate isomerase/epimerase family protein [Anaerolineae bacterium]
MKIGVMMSSFRLPAYPALERCAAVGAQGVQLRNESGELAPENLDAAGRKQLARRLADLKLEIAALCADYGQSYAKAAELGWLLPKMKAVIDLASDLEARVISTHVGTMPHSPADPDWAKMADALIDVGAYAAKRGVRLATETGPEEPALMADFLKAVASDGLAVNYDPANLVMKGFDHIEGVRILAPWIVHTHAKDGVRLPSGAGEEVPLGEGGVGFPRYLQALRQAGYDGYLTVEREVGDDPERDIRMAVAFLGSLAL